MSVYTADCIYFSWLYLLHFIVALIGIFIEKQLFLYGLSSTARHSSQRLDWVLLFDLWTTMAAGSLPVAYN